MPTLRAQAKPDTPPPKDVLTFTDDEMLMGHFVRSDGKTLIFHSEAAGDVTVEWAKVKELRTAGQVAVIEKELKLRRRAEASDLPQGTLDMTEQVLRLQPAAPAQPTTIPVGDTEHVIDQPTFQKVVLHRPGPFEAWKGSVTAGLTLVDATQHNRTFTGAFTVIRAVPIEDWLNPRSRTIVNFNGSYGRVTQPNTPEVKTAIYHFDGEQDEYFARRVYGFGQAAFDHNFSQGLDLQQRYGGGVGWTVIESPDHQLDLKWSVGYLKQQFATEAATQNQDLIGSTFEQSLHRTLSHGIVLQEQLSITGPWNNLNAYAGGGNVSLTVPVYKRISFTIGLLDTFLNDPPPGFRKNSVQVTTGLTYTLP